jgi:hypothetical protein
MLNILTISPALSKIIFIHLLPQDKHKVKRTASYPTVLQNEKEKNVKSPKNAVRTFFLTV